MALAEDISKKFLRKILMLPRFINSTLNCLNHANGSIVDQAHPLITSGKLVMQKTILLNALGTTLASDITAVVIVDTVKYFSQKSVFD